jgi:hypothetical protein
MSAQDGTRETSSIAIISVEILKYIHLAFQTRSSYFLPTTADFIVTSQTSDVNLVAVEIVVRYDVCSLFSLAGPGSLT